MKFDLICEEKLLEGAKKLAKRVGVTFGEGGIPVRAIPCSAPTLKVEYDGKCATVRYQKQCHFNRAFGILVENLQKGKQNFTIEDHPCFRTNGVMFDMCQGGSAFTPETMYGVLDQMALMGLNMLMLYAEDNYEVKEQPYFGYMRPTYTQAQMRAMDDYADSLGIEMIPCIQTLAHLSDALRWDVYKGIRDYSDCLKVGDEGTYKFLEDIIRAASAPFRSKRIHVGMDEAFLLGQGKYLAENGFRSRLDLMREHLGRVVEITDRLGLEPMMWDDMYFTSFGNRNYRQTGVKVPEEVKAMVPEHMSCVYWDYHTAISDERFEMQTQLTDRLWLATGIWSWISYGMASDYTRRAVFKALPLARKHGVRDVFLTTWGDAQSEILQSANLIGAQMHAEAEYRGEYDAADFADRFRFCTGGNAEDFLLLDKLDTPIPAGENDHPACGSGAKILMWQDPLTGLFDKSVEGRPINAYYADLAQKLRCAEGRGGPFAGVFRMSRQVAEVLAEKSELGVRMRAAYLAKDKDTLAQIANKTIPSIKILVEKLRATHREEWHKIYKPFGWDVMDLRYGGLLARLDSAKWALENYLAGAQDSIPELAAERLYYAPDQKGLWGNNQYALIASPSRIDFFAFLRL